jgi:hypothetical protein
MVETPILNLHRISSSHSMSYYLLFSLINFGRARNNAFIIAFEQSSGFVLVRSTSQDSSSYQHDVMIALKLLLRWHIFHHSPLSHTVQYLTRTFPQHSLPCRITGQIPDLSFLPSPHKHTSEASYLPVLYYSFIPSPPGVLSAVLLSY